MATNETVTLTAELKDEMSAPLSNAMRGVDNFTDAVVKGSRKQRDAVNKSTAQIGGDLGKQNRLFGGMTSAVSRATGGTARLFAGMRSAISRSLNGAAAEATRAGERTGHAYGDGLKTTLKAAAGAAAGIIGVGMFAGLVKEAGAASDATDKFKATMNFAGLDTSAITAATKDAKSYADQTVYDLPTIQNMIAQLASNGVKDYTGLTKAAGNLNAVAGGNAETFKSVAMTMTQTAGAGKLTTENWNQLADAIPGAAGPLMKALKDAGAYTGNFRDAMEKGQISSDEFNAALMKLGTKPVAVEAAKSTKTFEGAIGNLQATINSKLMGALDKIKPAATTAITALSDGLGKALDWVGDAAQGLYDLLVKGDYQGALRRAFGWEEDSKAVDMLLNLRDAALKVPGALKEVATKLWEFRQPITIIAGLILTLLIPYWVRLGYIALVSAGQQRLAWLMTQGAAFQAAYVNLWAFGITVAGWVLMGAQALIQGAKIAAGWLLAMGPVGWIIGIIALLVGAFVWAYNNVDWFRAGVDAAMKWIGEAFQNVGKWFSDVWAGIVEWWNGTFLPAVDAVGKWFSDTWNTVLTNVGNWFRDFIGFFVDGWGMLVDFYNGVLFPIIKTVGDVFAAVFDWVQRLVWNATTIVMALWLKVVDFWNGVLFPALKAVGDFFKSVFDWIWAYAVKPVIDFIVGAFNNIISFWNTVLIPALQAVGNWIGSVMAWIYNNIIVPYVNFWISVFQNIVNWWNGTFIPAMQAFGNFIGSVMNWIYNTLIKPVIDFIVSAFQSIVDWWNNTLLPAAQAVGSWFSEIIGGAINGVKSFIDDAVKNFQTFISFAQKTLQPVIDGIAGAFNTVRDAIDAVLGKIGEFANNPLGGIQDWLGIKKDGNGQGIMPTPGASGGGVFGGKFAGGGVLGGYAPGHDSILARLSPGESVLVPELTRAIGPQNIMAANAAASGGRPAGAGPSMTSGFANQARGGGGTTLNIGSMTFNVPVTNAGQVDLDQLREHAVQAMQDALNEHNRRSYR
jgi:tape measure domain-containing protein